MLKGKFKIMDKIKVRVKIAGTDYALTTEETAEYTVDLATEIDEKIKEIKCENPFISTNQAAVLLTLEYANECKKHEKSAENLRMQIKDYLEDSSQAKTERDFYKRELDRVRSEISGKANQINLFREDKPKDEE